jgi:protein tyrosine/serine phosphatase
MLLTEKSLRRYAAVIFTILAVTLISQAQEAAPEKTSSIKIKNFGQMDERFYRGAQPKETDYKDLAALGIKTIIDLTAEPKLYEQRMVESLGMKYVHIPMADKRYPTEEATKMFLKFAGDPATGKFFVHCAGGRHRTGAMGAVYRFQFYNWNFDQVYMEMKKYDFYTTWGHGAFKDFVLNYYEKSRAAKSSAHSATPAGIVHAQ